MGLLRAMPDEEPLLEAFFDGRGGLPVLSGPPDALARLRPDAALASDAENSGVTLAVASSSHVDVLGAAAPLTARDATLIKPRGISAGLWERRLVGPSRRN